MLNIEFCGELSSESKKFLYHIEHKLGILVWSLVAISISVVLISIGFAINAVIYLIPFVVLIIIFLIIIVLFPKIEVSPKELEKYYPKYILIDNKEIKFEGQIEKSYCCKELADIKKIIDFGNFYYIKFYFPFNHYCICQKNLITQGTIEEFEQLFKDEIVRKIK